MYTILLCRGVWNAPYVGDAVLFNGKWLANHYPNHHSNSYDPDMTWCQWMRDNVNTYHFFCLLHKAQVALFPVVKIIYLASHGWSGICSVFDSLV